MPRFFIPELNDQFTTITGESAHHISRSLRMQPGEMITLCDTKGFDYHCKIESVGEEVVVSIVEKQPSQTEPDIQVTLYQALPKGDKFEQIIQKSVELGVTEIVPVLTSRCISRPDQKSMAKKCIRYNKIALEAAKQSGKGIIPQVKDLMTFQQSIDGFSAKEQGILFYECGGKRLPEIISNSMKKISVWIGSEGGFEPSEVELAKQKGIQIGSMGKRILRCETAPLCALSIIMYQTENI